MRRCDRNRSWPAATANNRGLGPRNAVSSAFEGDNLFEQFKENIRLTGETYAAAREQFRNGRKAFKTAPPFKKAAWGSALGAIVVTAITPRFGIAWYYQVASVVVLAIALTVWHRTTHRTDS